MFSNKHVRQPDQIIHDGHPYQGMNNFTHVPLTLHNALRQTYKGSLIDGGANGGMIGNDVRVLEQTLHHADISGSAEHAVKDIPIVTAAACISNSRAVIVRVFHQYAHLGTGKTIHAANQMRHFGVMICEVPRVPGGRKRMRHPMGYVVPLSVRNGLPYMDMWKPSDE
jgi:hypothetical protein